MIYRTRFKIGQIINVKTGCSEKIDHISITSKGVKYGGITIIGFSKGSRWAFPENELIKQRVVVKNKR